MERTTNYKLPQWVESDRIMMEDFNDAMAKIDAGIAGAQESVDGTEQNLQEIASNLGTTGKNLRIETGSYIGNGKFQSGNPIALRTNLYPVMVQFFSTATAGYALALRPLSGAFLGMPECVLTWGNNSLQWYGIASASSMLNSEGETYHYIIFGYDPE